MCDWQQQPAWQCSQFSPPGVKRQQISGMNSGALIVLKFRARGQAIFFHGESICFQGEDLCFYGENAFSKEKACLYVGKWYYSTEDVCISAEDVCISTEDVCISTEYVCISTRLKWKPMGVVPRFLLLKFQVFGVPCMHDETRQKECLSSLNQVFLSQWI